MSGAPAGQASPSWPERFSFSVRRKEKVETVKPAISMRTNDEEFNRDFCTNYISTTKFHWYNFVLLVLYYQFKKLHNLFFLANAVVPILFPAATPVFPITSILPLVYVLVVALIKVSRPAMLPSTFTLSLFGGPCARVLKEGVEDMRRYQSDRKQNGRPAVLLAHGAETVVRSDKLRVGQFVKVSRDEQ
eukprot:gene6710-6423_t